MGAAILSSDEGRFGIDRAIEVLRSRGDVLDALERGVCAVEDDVRAATVGYGGAPDALGQMSLDASIMEGKNRTTGTVGMLRSVRNPITLARKVMETLPHVFLVGEGAERFAKELGVPTRDMLAPESAENLAEWRQNKGIEGVSQKDLSLIPLMEFHARKNLSFGTVTFIVRDNRGHFAAGASTSGWAYKYPGRLGDSPVIGAGVYVDDRYGAATCTHTGEMTIRAATAHSVVMHMRYGKSVQEACALAAEDLAALSGGYLGPVIIHAMSREGEPCVLQLGETDGDQYLWWSDGNEKAQAFTPTCFDNHQSIY
jgi:isoaspartyl peptidase/L-asparaginase-like protein (Ntn-hydrolase superfamily)